MKEVNLKLSVEEANTVLSALGNMPFSQVQQLIAKVQTQAQKQLNGESKQLKSEKK